jgi:hypothetical protein
MRIAGPRPLRLSVGHIPAAKRQCVLVELDWPGRDVRCLQTPADANEGRKHAAILDVGTCRPNPEADLGLRRTVDRRGEFRTSDAGGGWRAIHMFGEVGYASP